MTNDSILSMRESVVSWFDNLSNSEKLYLLDFLFEPKDKLMLLEIATGRKSWYELNFLDEVLTPIYCKRYNITLE